MFGTNEDLQNLFLRGKELGIKIILDFVSESFSISRIKLIDLLLKVPNHTSDQHEWFLMSANRTVGFEEFYIWRDCDIGLDGVTRDYPNNWVIAMSFCYQIADK